MIELVIGFFIVMFGYSYQQVEFYEFEEKELQEIINSEDFEQRSTYDPGGEDEPSSDAE